MVALLRLLRIFPPWEGREEAKSGCFPTATMALGDWPHPPGHRRLPHSHQTELAEDQGECASA